MEEPKVHHLEKLVDEGVAGIEKLQILTAFKTHVKKELVRDDAIERYFDALVGFLGAVVEDRKLQQLGHSSLCYLIKRVAMQQPGRFHGARIRDLVRVVLLQEQLQERKVWGSAVKSLEAIYLCKPQAFEAELARICAETRGSERTKCLLFMDELIQLQQTNNRNPMEVVSRFVDLWVDMLNEADPGCSKRDIELIHDILKKYFNEAMLQQFAERVVNARSLKHFMHTEHAAPSSAQTTSSMPTGPFDVDEELARVMEELPPNVVNSNISDARDYLSFEHVVKDLEHITVAFQAIKETEHNWKQRQEGIIMLRKIVNGNVSRQFPDEFVQACRDLNIADCISKAALSLRTTLSSHSCHLIKEIAFKLGPLLEPLLDVLFVPLRSLLSATKKISSQTAFATAAILLSTAPYHNRLFQQCIALSRDKNVSPRTFAAVFLRIYIIRFHRRLEHSSVLVEEWLHKGLADPQTQVREAMRVTFWYWYVPHAQSAKKVLDSMPHQMKRIIEGAIPTYLNIDYHVTASVSSNESSRRSSFGVRRYPSYAAPTQSSNLQKLTGNSLGGTANVRSLSENTNRHLTTYTSLAKKSLATRHESLSPRVASSGLISSAGAANLSSENLELTEELTSNHSNTLLKKYLNTNEPVVIRKSEGEPTGDLESMYSHLSSTTLQEKQQGLLFLRNLLLLKAPLDVAKLSPLLVQLSIQSPKSFKDLLPLTSFHPLIPLANLIELFAINDLPTNVLLDEFSSTDLLETIINSFQTFFPDHHDQLFLYYVKYRSVIFNYCFGIMIDLLSGDFAFPEGSTLFRGVCTRIIEACGNDFNMEKYYTLISILYRVDKPQFVELLRDAPVSSKFKIANELQRCDPSFNLHSIMSRESTAESHHSDPNHQHKDGAHVEDAGDDNDASDSSSNSDNEPDLESTKHLLEMTMVNPIGLGCVENVLHGHLHSYKQEQPHQETIVEKSLSTVAEVNDEDGDGSTTTQLKLMDATTAENSNENDKDKTANIVAESMRCSNDQNYAKMRVIDNALIDSEDEPELNTFGGLKGLTEMTKVVSIYEKLDGEEDIEMVDDEKFKDPVEQENQETGLDEIFRDEKHDQSVKFNDIPRIIDVNKSWDRYDGDSVGDTSGNSHGTDENRPASFGAVSELVRKEMEKSPTLPLNEEDSKLLSDGINEIELKRQDDPFVRESEDGDNTTIQNRSNFLSCKQHIDILGALPENSLTAFELGLLEILDVSDMDADRILETVNTIQNSRLRSTDVSRIVGAIVSHCTDPLLHWLAEANGLQRLWSMLTALSTTDGFSDSYKCVVLYTALLIANSQLSSSHLSTDELSDSWAYALKELSKLSSYNNETYIACCELRETLIEHYSSSYLPQLLESAIKELNVADDRVRITFLLQTLSDALDHMNTLLSLEVLSSMSSLLQQFVTNDFTEWRYHSIKLLAQIYGILVARNSPTSYIRSMFSILRQPEFELVKSYYMMDHN
ncbi:AaceriADL298Cp [[Ashbya] aceris (nom. inval.)]|nr:AaceriADL298Cp [[Ashbya] aceris (nom. inval.)]